jgi:hypothetical protein
MRISNIIQYKNWVDKLNKQIHHWLQVKPREEGFILCEKCGKRLAPDAAIIFQYDIPLGSMIAEWKNVSWEVKEEENKKELRKPLWKRHYPIYEKNFVNPVEYSFRKSWISVNDWKAT